MRKFIYLLASCLLLCACQNDNEQDKNDSIGAKVRVKRIVGENEIWGKYEMLFNYHADGRLANACRLDRNKEDIIPDTVGSIVVVYDYNYYNLKLMDHVLNIDNDSVRYLKDLYPDSYEDTLRQRRIPRVAYSIEFKDDRFIMQRNRPRKKTGSGKFFNNTYINVFSQTQIPEYDANGQLIVARCYNDTYLTGEANSEYERTVTKYEFTYRGNEAIAGCLYRPDSFNESSWSKISDLTLSYYSGILTSVDSDCYKMRRGMNQVVVAEPGVNTTYTLNEEGVAIKMEKSDGSVATIEYENGRGNFAELYATPTDHFLGKVWVK